MSQENTKENRLKVYKAALEYGKKTNWAGFCCWISRSLTRLDMEFMPDPYSYGAEVYEELIPYKPGEESLTIWFPYDAEGYQTRFKILETIIAEMEC